MPFRPSPQASPRDLLIFDVRMCFIAAAGCFFTGGLGWLAQRLIDLDNHLPALIAAGGFYGVMGLTRWWKLSHTSDRELQSHSAQHGH